MGCGKTVYTVPELEQMNTKEVTTDHRTGKDVAGPAGEWEVRGNRLPTEPWVKQGAVSRLVCKGRPEPRMPQGSRGGVALDMRLRAGRGKGAQRCPELSGQGCRGQLFSTTRRLAQTLDTLFLQ